MEAVKHQEITRTHKTLSGMPEGQDARVLA